MNLITKDYETLTADEVKIREDVFMKEQGFENEFDEIDEVARHLVMYDENRAIACCRYFTEEKDSDDYIIGRLAVIKDYRGKQIGSRMLVEAEQFIKEHGGASMKLHAQCRVSDFYEKQGFKICSGIELDEGCPHVWMVKELGGEDHE